MRLEPFDGAVAELSRVLLDAGPVPLDEVELEVKLGKEDAEVAPRQHELLDRVLLLLEVSLLREQKLEAARDFISPAHVHWNIDALPLADAHGLFCRLALLPVRGAALAVVHGIVGGDGLFFALSKNL